MRTRGMWNRRQVLQASGSIGALSGLGTLTRTAAAWNTVASAPSHAYVGSLEGGGSIQVFSIKNERWSSVQTIASARPANLVLHPNGKSLYVANEIDLWRGLPCGSVEAYALDEQTGTLTKLSEEPLALSATLPRGLAVSPDGRHLVVAVYGGGAYNLLPILEDGSLGRVISILKQTGSGPHAEHQRSAHPHTVLFGGTSGSLFGTDSGSDRVNRLQISDGKLKRVSQTSLPGGSAPAQLALHPAGHLLFILNSLQGSIASLCCTKQEGQLDRQLCVTSCSTSPPIGTPGSMVIHPSGEFLYTAQAQPNGRIDGWHIDAGSGSLSRIRRASSETGHFRVMAISPSGEILYALDENRGQVLQLPIYPVSGHIGIARPVAAVQLPRTLAVKLRGA